MIDSSLIDSSLIDGSLARPDACASDNRFGMASAARPKAHSQFPPDQFTLDAEDDDRTCQNLSSRRALSFVMRAN
jgi:hypothetical protein